MNVRPSSPQSTRSLPMSRRNALGLAGLGAGLALTTSACGSGGSGAGGSGGSAGGVLTGADLAEQVQANTPSSELSFLVEPDYPSVNGSTPGYAAMPSEFETSVPDTPGAGSTFTVMSPAWWTTPPSLGDNAYYDAVNEALGATLDFQPSDGNAYADKIQTVLASPRSMPDWIVLPSWNIPPRFIEGVENMFSDLTEHLQGDGIKDYPNLARLDPATWQYCMFNGRIFGLPYPSELITDALFYRRDLFGELGLDVPTSADELLAVLAEATDASANRWGCEDIWTGIQLLHGLPPTFREEGGALVHRFETPEFKEAIALLTEIIAQGSMHPDAVAGTGNAKDRFEAGQTLVMNDGVGGWHEGLARVRPGNPDYDPMAMDFFAPDGGDPVLFRSHPVNIFSFLKKSEDEERVKEALRIADFCAAQFGTTENTLLSYGEEGVHHTLDEDGVPQLTDQGSREITSTYEFLAQPAISNSVVQFPEYVRDSSEWMARQSEFVQEPLFFGIQIQEPAKFGSLGQPIDDLVVDISRGRASIDTLDAAVEKWRTDGGDELREFYAEFLD